MVYSSEYETLKTIWNMDEAALKRIDYLLTLATNHFYHWNLESLYWTLRGIRREISAKLKEEEKKDLLGKLRDLEKKREEFAKNPKDKKIKGEFYICCEEFSIKMTTLMKKHGLFFREGDDPRRAVLQR